MSARWMSLCSLALVIATLGGCGDTSSYLDPYTKPYTWHPTGAPTANLAAQLVNPHDLVSGRGDGPATDSQPSSLAIERIWQDRPKQIATETAGSGRSSGSGSSTGSGGGSN